MKKALIALVFCLSVGNVLAQTNGSYRSRQTGNWNQITTWQVFNSGWHDLESSGAGGYQNSIPSNIRGVITISSNTTVTVPGGYEISVDQLEFGQTGILHVDAAGILNITNGAGHDVRLFNDGINFSQLLLSGFIRLLNNATIVNDNYAGIVLPASNATTVNTYKVLSGGLHIHASSDALPYADWQIGSAITYYATNTNPTIADPSIQFHNFHWDGRAQTADLTFNGNLRNINGNLTVSNTNGRVLTLGNATNYTLNVGGAFNIAGNSNVTINLTATVVLNIGTISSPGNFGLSGGTINCSSTGNTTVNITGNLSMTSGALVLRSSLSTPGTTDLNISGNFSQTGGSIYRGGFAGSTNINFIGSGTTSSFTKTSGSIFNTVNYTVANGKTLNLGTSTLTGSGSLTLFSGSLLGVGALDAAGAIQSNTTGGNIRVSGARIYQTGSTIVYNGAAPQFVGTGHHAGPNVTIDNLNGVTLLLNVNFNGNLAVNGPFDTQQWTITFAGGLAQTISGSNTLTIYDLIVNKTGSGLTLSTNVDIQNSLRINSATTINAGTEQLRLLSTATRTASVAPLVSGASINGSVIVQRHLPNNANVLTYRYISSPVTNAMVSDWQNEIPITGTFSNPSTGSGINSGAPSMFYYDETYTAGGPDLEDRYRNYPATGSSTVAPLVNALGYSLYVRSSGPMVFDTRGTLAQGPRQINVTAQSNGGNDGWNLIGNPYPAPINWSNVSRPAGVNNAVYMYDNANNANNGLGFVTYINGVGSPASFQGVIAQGQAFFVRATQNATLTFQEDDKVVAQTQFYRQREVPNVLRIALTGQNQSDETVIRLHEDATDQFDDEFDAFKFPNPTLNLATLMGNSKLVINSLNSIDCKKSIPLVIEGAVQGSYQLSFTGIATFENIPLLILLDKAQNKQVDLSESITYSFTVAEGDLIGLKDRFELLMGTEAIAIDNTLAAFGEAVCEKNETAYITVPNAQPNVTYRVQWNGENVSDAVVGNGTDLRLAVNISTLPKGSQEMTIIAQVSTCSSVVLETKPKISILGNGLISNVQGGSVCGAGTVALKAFAEDHGAQYHWYEELNDTAPVSIQSENEFTSPTLTKSKTYYVASVNSLGCESERVAVQAQVIYMDSVNIRENGSTLISSYDEGNQWYLDGVAIEGGTSKEITAVVSGIYSVQVNNNGCNTLAFHEVTINEETVLSSDVIGIYPNPTADKITVMLRNNNADTSVKLLSPLGVELNSLDMEATKQSGEFDLRSYPQGVYLVRVQNGKSYYTKKVTKID